MQPAIQVVTPGDDREAFAARIEPFLLTDEAVHCLHLAWLSAWRTGQPGEITWRAVSVNDEVVATSAQSGGWQLVISRITDPIAVAPLVAAWRSELEPLPGVMGPTPAVDWFRDTWCNATGDRFNVEMNERILQTREVRAPAGVPGGARIATEADVDLLARWGHAFWQEALPPAQRAHHTEEMAREWAIHKLEPPSGALLWEDETGAPVSLCGWGRPTPHGIIVAPVYTPPNLRNRGYGAAITAAATQRLLDGGYDLVFLFTDAGNPIPNHVYEKIGYRGVAGIVWYRFERDPE